MGPGNIGLNVFFGPLRILSKSMLSKCAKFDYFSKVGEWIPKYFQSVLDVTLGFSAPWEPFSAIFVHIWASRGTQKIL